MVHRRTKGNRKPRFGERSNHVDGIQSLGRKVSDRDWIREVAHRKVAVTRGYQRNSNREPAAVVGSIRQQQ